jgi:hypothetical protein
MSDERDRSHCRRCHALRWILFAALALIVLPLTWGDIAARWSDRMITQRQIDDWIALPQSDAGPLDTSQLETVPLDTMPLETMRLALERISMDLAERMQHDRRYFDREYVGGQIELLRGAIAAAPRPAFHLLAHYALLEEQPLQQVLAIIAVRECYPRKFSIVFATRFAHAKDPMLAGLCQSILSGRYRREGLERKYHPRFLGGITAVGRPAVP